MAWSISQSVYVSQSYYMMHGNVNAIRVHMLCRLSGCVILDDGCASLCSALSSNPSYLRELDLSYNHPGEEAIARLSAGLEDPLWKLETLWHVAAFQ